MHFANLSLGLGCRKRLLLARLLIVKRVLNFPRPKSCLLPTVDEEHCPNPMLAEYDRLALQVYRNTLGGGPHEVAV